MAHIEIFGESDDLVEIDGTVNGCDEYYYSQAYVTCFPTGDVFKIIYGENSRGVWKISHEKISGHLEVNIKPCPAGDDPEPYSDLARITGDITRVECWSSYPTNIDEIRERLEERLEYLSDPEILKIWNALERSEGD